MEELKDIFKEGINKTVALQKNRKKMSEDWIFLEFYIKILEKLRYFEVDSISDLKNNYKRLSNLSFIEFPLKNIYDKRDFLVCAFKYIYNDSYFDSIGRHFNNPGSLVVEINLNLANIEGVYLENLKNIEGRIFKAFEFDIKDIYNEKIKGMFVYSSKMSWPEDSDTSKKQIEKLLLSSPLDSFDIRFKVFSRNTIIYNMDTDYPKEFGKKLYVINIQGNDKRGKEEDYTPVGSNVSSLISVH